MIHYEPLPSVDLTQLADFHQHHLGGQLTRLGRSYIRFFYSSALKLPETFGWAALDDERLVGFVFGSTLAGQLPSRVMRRQLFLGILESFKSATLHPVPFAQALKSALVPTEVAEPGSAELHFIAVDGARRGQHIGKELLRRFVHDAAARGRTHFTLSVAAENHEAKGFYEKNDGRLTENRVEAGMLMHRYRFEVK